MKSILTSLPDAALREIVDELDSGLRCFIHRETGNVINLPQEKDMYYVDDEAWAEDMEEIEANGDQYLWLEPMESRDSFRIMQAFAEDVATGSLQRELLTVLERKRPFANFNAIMHNSLIRDKWFSFKRDWQLEWLKAKLDAEEPWEADDDEED